MNKEDLYDKLISVNVNNSVELQTILFEFGFVWCTSGKKYIEIKSNSLIILRRNLTNIDLVDAKYNENIMYLTIISFKNAGNFINGDNIIRKFKMNKLNE